MSESKKSEWREKLFYQQKNGYDLIDAEESRLAFASSCSPPVSRTMTSPYRRPP